MAPGFGVTSGGVTPSGYGLASLADAFPDGFLPLRIVGHTGGARLEATALSVDPGPVADSLFQALAER